MIEDPSDWLNDPHAVKAGKYDVDKHKRERVENGFSTYDWWNFSSYLSWVIVQGLERFKTEGHGYPADEGHTIEHWNVLLDVMIDGFEANEEMTRINRPKDVEIRDWLASCRRRHDIGMTVFGVYFGGLWD